MKSYYAAVIQRDGPWWIGWVLEVPGVNSQGTTKEELIENLRSALSEALEMNRADALAAITGEYEEIDLRLRVDSLSLRARVRVRVGEGARIEPCHHTGSISCIPIAREP
jgi:predicted RNase H-like HicB family nuclease